MPLIETEENYLRYGDVLVPQKAPGEDPDDRGFFEAFGEAAMPAMRQMNTVVSTFNYMNGITTSGPAPEGYDPYDDIAGYEDYAGQFTDALTPEDVARIKGRVDKERRDKETIAAAGWAGIAASFTAGLVDPLLLLPIGGQLKVGQSALRTGLSTMRTAALATTAQEAILLNTQSARGLDESAMNITAATLMSGILGLGVGALRRIPAELPPPPRTDTFPLPTLRELSPAMPRVDAEEIRLAAARKPLLAKAAEIDAKLATLPPADTAAVAALRALRVIETKLADQTIDATERVTLSRQRDEILGSTTPEKLAAGAKPIEQRAALEAEKAQVETYLTKLDEQVEEVARVRDKAEIDLILARDEQMEMLAKVQAMLPKIEQELMIPEGADPMQPGFVTITAEELAEDTSEAAALGAGRAAATAATSVDGETGGQGGGGAQRTSRSEAKLVSALGAEKALRWTSPMLRLSTSTLVETRRAVMQLLQTPYRYIGNALGIAEGPAVVTRINLGNAHIAEFVPAVDSLYVQYRTGKAGKLRDRLALQASDLTGSRPEGTLSYEKFLDEVSFASRREDKSNIPEVHQAAKAWRKVADYWKDQAIEVKLFTKEEVATTMPQEPSYLTRRWLGKKIGAEQFKFTRMVKEWLKEEQAKVKPDADEDAITFSQLTDAELQDIADTIATTMKGTPGGRIHYGKIPVALKSGTSLKPRSFNIPSTFKDKWGTKVEDFLENNIINLARQYVRTMAPDIEIARTFGTADMAEPLRQINDAWNKRISNPKATPAQREAMEHQRKMDILHLSAVRDQVRGTNTAPDDDMLTRIVDASTKMNFLSMMGSVTVSSMPDAGMIVFRHGFARTFARGLVPLVRNLRGFKLAVEEGRKMGVAADMIIGSTAQNIADIGDDYGRATKFERGLSAATSAFSNLSLMNPWNIKWKQFASVIEQSTIIEDALAVADGKATTAQVTRLAESRIPMPVAEKIAKQFRKWGQEDRGVMVSYAHQWDDPEALLHFKAAVLRNVDLTITNPTAGQKPLVMTGQYGINQNTAKIVGQFRGFMFAATQNLLISGLQRRDLATLSGASLMVTLGMLSYKIKSDIAGQDTSPDIRVWISEGVDRSGLTGSLYDVNNIVEKLTRGHVGINALSGGPPMTRYQSRNLLGALLGPSVGKLGDIGVATGTVSDAIAGGGEISEGDRRAILRLVPGQNLFYLNALMRAADPDNGPR